MRPFICILKYSPPPPATPLPQARLLLLQLGCEKFFFPEGSSALLHTYHHYRLVRARLEEQAHNEVSSCTSSSRTPKHLHTRTRMTHTYIHTHTHTHVHTQDAVAVLDGFITAAEVDLGAYELLERRFGFPSGPITPQHLILVPCSVPMPEGPPPTETPPPVKQAWA
jgi:hypothetical protein